MAKKKLSAFGAAFNAAQKSGAKEFSFGGKSYNTKMKSEGGAKKSALPKTAPVPTKRPGGLTVGNPDIPIPRPRGSVASGKRMNALNPSQQQGRMSGASDGVKMQSGPSKRGGGPKIAMSQANIDKRKKAKDDADKKIRTPGKYKLPKF